MIEFAISPVLRGGLVVGGILLFVVVVNVGFDLAARCLGERVQGAIDDD